MTNEERKDIRELFPDSDDAEKIISALEKLSEEFEIMVSPVSEYDREELGEITADVDWLGDIPGMVQYEHGMAIVLNKLA